MNWWQPFLLTLQLIAGSVLLSGLLGILGAWAAMTASAAGGLPSSGHGASSERRGGGVGQLASQLFLLAMVVAIATPLVLHAAAWEAAAGKFGWLSLTQTGSRTYQGLAGRYSGMVACTWVHGLFGAAWVALATLVGVRRIPTVLLQQASLEMSPWQRWWRVQLLLAAPWTIAALLATAAFAATEMTVADLYGVRTLADEFYLFYASQPSVAAMVRTLVLPVVLGLTIIAILILGKRRKFDIQDRFATESNVFCPVGESDNSRLLTTVAIAVIGVCVLLITLVPILSLLIKVGHDVTVVTAADGTTTSVVRWSLKACLQRLVSAPGDFAKEYQWTLIIGAGAAVLATLIGWPLASLGRRSPKARLGIDMLAIAVFLIPGPIVGLLIVKLFALPLPGARSLYQQTLIPTWIALSFRAVPIAYWILGTGYDGIARDIMDASRLDLSWWQRLWKVDRPLLMGSLLASGLAVAVFATGDVPATLPVIPPGVTTVGTRLFALLHSGARYQEASLAAWYLLSIVLIACWGYRRVR